MWWSWSLVLARSRGPRWPHPNSPMTLGWTRNGPCRPTESSARRSTVKRPWSHWCSSLLGLCKHRPLLACAQLACPCCAHANLAKVKVSKWRNHPHCGSVGSLFHHALRSSPWSRSAPTTTSRTTNRTTSRSRPSSRSRPEQIQIQIQIQMRWVMFGSEANAANLETSTQYFVATCLRCYYCCCYCC